VTAKRLVALTLAVVLAAGAALWRGGSNGAPSTPAGKLAFSSPDLSDVVVAALDGSDRQRLTWTVGPQFDPSFRPMAGRSPIGTRRGINRDDEIWVMDADGSHAANLTRNSANDWSPAWSPDGRSIAFASTRLGALNLWSMATDGSNPRRLTRSSSEYPSWSPDSSRIAFSLLSAGPVQIGVIDRDGGAQRILTPITENSELPAWSPDGSHIAFCRGFEGHRAIWTMRADGTDAHRLTTAGSDDVGPTWSPDGHFIAFSRRGTLMIMRSDGSDSRPVGVRGTLPAWTAPPNPHPQ
jgi:Tol biopolymer transport system component